MSHVIRKPNSAFEYGKFDTFLSAYKWLVANGPRFGCDFEIVLIVQRGKRRTETTEAFYEVEK